MASPALRRQPASHVLPILTLLLPRAPAAAIAAAITPQPAAHRRKIFRKVNLIARSLSAAPRHILFQVSGERCRGRLSFPTRFTLRFQCPEEVPDVERHQLGGFSEGGVVERE